MKISSIMYIISNRAIYAHRISTIIVVVLSNTKNLNTQNLVPIFMLICSYQRFLLLKLQSVGNNHPWKHNLVLCVCCDSEIVASQQVVDTRQMLHKYIIV